MAKMTMKEALRIAMPVLSATRKVRDIVEGLLVEKRMAEDAVTPVKQEYKLETTA